MKQQENISVSKVQESRLQAATRLPQAFCRLTRQGLAPQPPKQLILPKARLRVPLLQMANRLNNKRSHRRNNNRNCNYN